MASLRTCPIEQRWSDAQGRVLVYRASANPHLGTGRREAYFLEGFAHAVERRLAGLSVASTSPSSCPYTAAWIRRTYAAGWIAGSTAAWE